jgi:uncharacterized protein YbaR (Trm112 family)
MALDKRLLEILCCPTTKQPVGPASAAQLQALNAAIAAGGVVDGEGTPVATRMAAALVTRDGRTVFRVDDGIPVMLADQAVSTGQIPGFPT